MNLIGSPVDSQRPLALHLKETLFSSSSSSFSSSFFWGGGGGGGGVCCLFLFVSFCALS